ncbi:GIY-YIG nuclease family protein [Patescibacteria group bacterium]|nr:GIY-YIG nuclease family protein [Patescibacteria group bacterium]MBU1034310.1 GIY-YIG nuclease family protein [Patescibacteria group bacterium]MBU1629568.1 GIY-YIG nuclease family protein [Patescibacteria group bacterium]MBU1907564.1 GIY-YIG nuclease family protein [Patescibacteria group bacterium]
MPQHEYFVYIMASSTGTLYVGVTSNLEKRVVEHQQGLIEGFTKKYGCNKLIYFEQTSDVRSALEREKQIKNWRREKKQNLLKTLNPQWKDLSLEW